MSINQIYLYWRLLLNFYKWFRAILNKYVKNHKSLFNCISLKLYSNKIPYRSLIRYRTKLIQVVFERIHNPVYHQNIFFLYILKLLLTVLVALGKETIQKSLTFFIEFFSISIFYLSRPCFAKAIDLKRNILEHK